MGEGRRKRRRRVEPTDDWKQLKLLFGWPEQVRYEELRPLVLFGSSVAERAIEIEAAEKTLYRRMDRFETEGMESLFDSETARHRKLPPTIWRLPEIGSVKVARVRYRTPVQYAEGASRKEAYEAIEFHVTTSADFPIRALAPALAPALFVGDTAVTESKRVGDRKYLFVSYGRHEFKDDALISVGWFGSGTPERKLSRFTFRVEGEETR